MNHNSFLLTGHQRSGTKWLAGQLNRSATWRVEHEPDGSRTMRIPIRDVKRRFERDNYGEVNSVARFVAPYINVRKGVIVRDMFDLWCSVASRYPEREWRFRLRELRDTVSLMKLLRMQGAITVQFERMTKEPSYVVALARHLGIDDLETADCDLTPTNVTVGKTYRSIAAFDRTVQDYLSELAVMVGSWRKDDERWLGE